MAVFGGIASSAWARGPLDTVTSALPVTQVQTQSDPGVNDTVGTVNGVTGAVSGAVNGVTGGVANTTGSASGTVNDVAGGATGAVGSLAGSDGNAVSGVLSGSSTSGSGTGAASSGTGGSVVAPAASSSGTTDRRRARTSNRGSPKTAFDRLPRRYESLLERIEAGRHVRSNLARLSALLASATPRARAEILRLIGAEIRRLERGGLTGRERAMLERLERTRVALAPNRSARAAQGSSPSPAHSAVAAGSAQARGTGRNAAFGVAHSPARSHDSGGGNGLLSLPSVPGPPYLLVSVLAALAGGLLLAVAAGRRMLPAHIRGVLAAHGGAQLSALAVTVGLIVAVAVAFMVQAFLP